MKPTLKALAQATAIHCRIKYEDLVGPSRKKVDTEPRHIFFYIARKAAGHSLSHIGRWADKDHTSVMYAVRKMEGKVTDFTTHRIVTEAKQLDDVMRKRVRAEIDRTWGKSYDPKR
jgi:chromosomal replication initiator protein